jgi:hypothetical protein
MLNCTTLASDARVPGSSMREYFHIVQDTLLT